MNEAVPDVCALGRAVGAHLRRAEHRVTVDRDHDVLAASRSSRVSCSDSGTSIA